MTKEQKYCQNYTWETKSTCRKEKMVTGPRQKLFLTMRTQDHTWSGEQQGPYWEGITSTSPNLLQKNQGLTWTQLYYKHHLPFTTQTSRKNNKLTAIKIAVKDQIQKPHCQGSALHPSCAFWLSHDVVKPRLLSLRRKPLPIKHCHITHPIYLRQFCNCSLIHLSQALSKHIMVDL